MIDGGELLMLLVAVVFVIRVMLFFVYSQQSGNPGFLIPALLELFFVYPAPIVMWLGLSASVKGVFIFALTIWSVQIGLMPLTKILPTRREKDFLLSEKDLSAGIKIATFFGAIYCVGVLKQILDSGFQGLLVFSADSLSEVANDNAVNRYASVLNVSPFYKIGVVASFACAVVSGLFFNFSINVKQRILLLVVLFVPGFIDSIFMAARAGLMMLLVVWASSMYLSFVYLKGCALRLNVSKTILRLLIGLVVLVVFFALVQTLRAGSNDVAIEDVLSHLLTWFFGYIPAFCQWIDNGGLDTKLEYGVYTFAGIADLLGFFEKKGGIFEMVPIGDGRYSNVFTAFRGLIEDFGLISSWVLLALGGLVCSLAIGKHVMAKDPFRYIGFVLLYMGFLGWSFVVSLYTYNSVLLGLVLGVACAKFITQGRSHSWRPK